MPLLPGVEAPVYPVFTRKTVSMSLQKRPNMVRKYTQCTIKEHYALF